MNDVIIGDLFIYQPYTCTALSLLVIITDYNNYKSELSLFHGETQGFWSILKVIPSNLTVFDSKR